ncbi:MAG: hypothetical protein IPP44_17495 [Ideonella sp.]|nr:hypothetical protein [Ideonella sp.]
MQSTLTQAAKATPSRATSGTATDKPATPAAEPGFAQQWGQLSLVLDATQREMRADSPWLVRLRAVQDRALRLYSTRGDASLYHLIYTAGHFTERYSSHHSLLCMVIAHSVAKALNWSAELISSMDMASLTMNASMRVLQDSLAAGTPLITGKVRAEIDGHAVASAELLAACGATDVVWMDIVRLHHDDSCKKLPLAELGDAQRAARVLRRVDQFAAKLSRRATRAPMSPVKAAREACVGADGAPDEIGAALLGAVGLYPPGSCVELVSNEIGLVVARGKRANQPKVGVLIMGNGAPLGLPLLRDCHDERYAVRGALSVSAMKTKAPHDAMLAASP